MLLNSNRFSSLVMTAVMTLFFVPVASSHDRWLVASHSTVSGEDPSEVALDFSISNQIFHPDIGVGSSDNPKSRIRGKLLVQNPDGSVQPKLTFYDLGRKSSAFATLEQNGTHTMFVQSEPFVFMLYQDQQGERHRMFGTDTSKLPNGASNVTVQKFASNIMTYVSRNKNSAIVPFNQGLELGVKGQHPNDLFSGEAVNLQVLLDGKPAPAGIEVKLVKGGTRYRNNRNEVALTTDQSGLVAYTFKEAGLYLLTANTEVVSKDKHIDAEYSGLFLTLEVLPF